MERERGGRKGRGKEMGRRMGGRESSEISTHHSPVSVSGMMDSSFLLWGKVSIHQLIHNKRNRERV